MTTSNLQHQISEIFALRQPSVHRIADVREKLDQLHHHLKNLVNYGQGDHAKLTDEQKASIAALPVGEILRHTDNIQKDLARLQARFSRETLNIGVIGRARQGKSRLLQSLTGLSRREIPDADGMHCTGVRSSICHNAEAETYADVYFYDEKNFLDEIIAPYFRELNLGNPPQSIEEFSVRELAQGDPAGMAVDLAKFEHLKKYQNSLPEYRLLLGHASPLRITQEDIPKYITQYDPGDSKIAYFNYLAVREVRIFCSFPNEDVGKIAVVDMPGLGDTGIGDEERMVSTLSEEIDFILFVRMPKHTGDYWADVDVRLYDIANRALQGTSLETWSFQILNALADGSNQRNCEDLRETIKTHHLKVAQTIIANCADSATVQTAILPPVLDHIAKYITVLDRRFMEASERKLIDLQKSLADLAQQAGQSITLVSGAQEYSIFDNLFQDFWNEKLTLDLEMLRIDLWQHRQDKDPNLSAAIEKAYQEAKEQTAIPSIEEIRKKSMQKGSINKAYYDLLDIVRVNLSEKFQSQLDESLKQSVDELKTRIAGLFANAGLSSLTDRRDVTLLAEILDLIENNPDHDSDQGMQKIHCGFQDLLDFQLYYRGLAQPRIRKHLDYLTAPREGISGERCAPELGQNPSAETIAEMLKELHSEALYKINEELQDLLWEPSMSLFSITEEFLDSVLRAENVESSWRKFLWYHREKVWVNEFKWQHLIASVNEYSKPGKFAMF